MQTSEVLETSEVFGDRGRAVHVLVCLGIEIMNASLVQKTNARMVLVAAVCLGLAALAGCEKGRATVSGKVTFNGQALTAGTVSFVAGPNRVGSDVIHPDGTYTIADAPIGDVTITVNTPEPPKGPAMARGPDKPPPGVQGMPSDMKPPGAEELGKSMKIVPAPTKYKNAETSPLKFTVQPGTQTKDIDLTP
jgi:hypothetical protein